ncbi:Ig-like domain-containing protein, partial [bacterium]|nr:Ig-like domain-containing protein [bacterium]
PRMVFFRLIDAHHIQVEFDRTLDPEPLKDADNFTVTARSGDDAEVVLARLDQATGRQLVLEVTGLTPGGTYTLRARNLRSGEGRPLDPLEREFIADAPPDELPPRAIITSPAESSSDQPAIYAQFSEAVRLGPEITATLAEVLPDGEPEAQPDGDAPPIEEVPPPEEKVELGPAMDLEPRVVGDRVFLGLPEPLAPGKRYQVTLDGVLDLAGNATEEPEVWRFSVADPEEGYTLEGTVSNADGTALPPDLVLTVSKDPTGELPLAYPLLSENTFTVQGLTATNARSSPFLIAWSEVGGWRYEGFFDEDSDGDADRLGAADAGELRVIGLTLRRRDIQGPDVGLEVLEPATGATAVVTAEVIDDTGVELVEAFLDSPGNDGTGAPFTVPPWMNLPGDRRLTARLALNTADWEPGETHQLHVHAKDTGGVWGGMAVLELTKGGEGPVLTGKAVYG